MTCYISYRRWVGWVGGFNLRIKMCKNPSKLMTVMSWSKRLPSSFLNLFNVKKHFPSFTDEENGWNQMPFFHLKVPPSVALSYPLLTHETHLKKSLLVATKLPVLCVLGIRCHISQNASISLNLCQFNYDLHET